MLLASCSFFLSFFFFFLFLVRGNIICAETNPLNDMIIWWKALQILAKLRHLFVNDKNSHACNNKCQAPRCDSDIQYQSFIYTHMCQSFLSFSKAMPLFCLCVAPPLSASALVIGCFFLEKDLRFFRRSSTVRESHKYMWVCVSWRHLEPRF